MKKPYIYALLGALVLVAAYFFIKPKGSEVEAPIFHKINSSDFKVAVNATGELKAKKSIKITGPQGMRSAGIYNTTIKDLIPEGTVVQKGDFVATLDKTELATKISSIQTDIEKENTKLEQIKIDTAIQMKGLRDEIGNQEFSMAQERLEIERNKYEPQMVIDQSQLKLENSKRTMSQLRAKEELMVIQSDAKVREIQANLKQLQAKLMQMSELAGEFRIVAPEDGMLIYERGWEGKKGPGSQISSWDPTVAELPDLTKMISVAYINEVDISKIKKGQIVQIKVDAFPEKEFTGQIITVANIGQELNGQEAKVFEIAIAIDQVDDVLRPAMTTSNEINIYNYADVLNIPLEGFYSDSIDYVFLKTSQGIVKQQIISGPTNEDNIVTIAGLNADSEILLTIPDNADKIHFNYLTQAIASNAKNQLAQWAEEKDKFDEENKMKVKDEKDENKDSGESVSFIVF